MGYCYAFGGNIWPFLSLSDIFSVSLGDISYIYLIALPGALVPFVIRASTGTWTRGEAVAKIEDPDKRSQQTSDHTKRRRNIFIQDWLFVSLFLLSAIAGYFISGIILYLGIGVALALTASNMTIFVLNRFNVHGPQFVFLGYLPMVIVLTAFIGMQVGENDAKRTFKAASKSAAICGSYAVLRPFSPMYLAVGRNNQHYLIDQNCKPKFLINRSA